jgi:hypothetical protein
MLLDGKKISSKLISFSNYLLFRNLFIANIRHSRIDAISLNGQYHTVVYSNHENETGIQRPLALDLDTTNG